MRSGVANQSSLGVVAESHFFLPEAVPHAASSGSVQHVLKMGNGLLPHEANVCSGAHLGSGNVSDSPSCMDASKTPKLFPSLLQEPIDQPITVRFANAQAFLEHVAQRDPSRREFLQALQEFLVSVWPFIEQQPRYAEWGLLNSLIEPRSVTIFQTGLFVTAGGGGRVRSVHPWMKGPRWS